MSDSEGINDGELGWDRAKIKKVLDVLKEFKDFHRMPLPMEIHKAFDIPLAKPRNANCMDYFERYMEIQRLPVDKVEVIDGTKAHKDVVFPTSILEPSKNPYSELQLDDGEQPRVIVHQEGEKVFSTDEEKLSIELPECDKARKEDAEKELSTPTEA